LAAKDSKKLAERPENRRVHTPIPASDRIAAIGGSGTWSQEKALLAFRMAPVSRKLTSYPKSENSIAFKAAFAS
jgi:hypothetical protein